MMATLRDGLSVSIHAPVKEATRRDGGSIGRHRVSIHAPMKEATGGSPVNSVTATGFDPRPMKEATLALSAC